MYYLWPLAPSQNVSSPISLGACCFLSCLGKCPANRISSKSVEWMNKSVNEYCPALISENWTPGKRGWSCPPFLIVKTQACVPKGIKKRKMPVCKSQLQLNPQETVNSSFKGITRRTPFPFLIMEWGNDAFLFLTLSSFWDDKMHQCVPCSDFSPTQGQRAEWGHGAAAPLFAGTLTLFRPKTVSRLSSGPARWGAKAPSRGERRGCPHHPPQLRPSSAPSLAQPCRIWDS